MKYVKFLHWKNNCETFDFRILPFGMIHEEKTYLSIYIGYLSTKEWHIINFGLIRFSFKKKETTNAN